MYYDKLYASERERRLRFAMRFAFQTILWGPNDNLTEALPIIRSAGFTGVELAQPPGTLGPLDELIGRLDENKLQLIGLAGGSLEERMRYIPHDFKHRGEKPYLYTDDWYDGPCDEALAKGYRLALHPHYPSRATRLKYAWEILENHIGLEWLPDTAHLFINWEDLEQAITKFPRKLAALHLKDWTPEYGRSTYSVAKGFIELGKGHVLRGFDLWGILDQANFGDKWLVVELDYARIDSRASVFECAQWLVAEKKMRSIPPPPATPSAALEPLTLEALCAVARDTPEVFYQKAVAGLFAIRPGIATSIWTNNASNGKCVFQQSHSPTEVFGDHAYRAGSYVSSQTAIDATAHWIPIGEAGSDQPPQHPAAHGMRLPAEHLETYRSHGVRHLLSIPVLATYNKHQVRFVIHYLLGDDFTIAEWEPLRKQLADTVRIFGLAADAYMDELCQTAAARTAIALDQEGGLEPTLELTLNRLAHLIKRELRCQGVTVFKADPSETRLTEGGSTGIEWYDQKNKFYSIHEMNLTSRILRERQAFLVRSVTRLREDEDIGNPKSREDVPERKHDNCAFAPFRGSQGKLLGAVRCRNKMDINGVVREFTEDDLAVLQAIFQTAAPLVEMRMASELQVLTTTMLFHELAQPLVSIRAAIYTAKSILDHEAPNILNQPYLQKSLLQIDLMRRLLKSPLDVLEPKLKETLLFADVIIPSVNLITDLVRERSLPRKGIDYGKEADFHVVPALLIDPSMFQQVFFNLLTNAAKYVGNPSRFRVEIRAEAVRTGYCIHFCDWGIGIEERWREAIFEKGVRAEGYARESVEGRGLGLWFARQILAKHQSKIWVSKLKDPTEFTIWLPRDLKAHHFRGLSKHG